MTRTEVKDFILSGVNSLRPATEFGRGRISEFSSLRTHSYPAVWLETRSESEGMETDLIESTQLPLDAWQIRLHIAMLDKTDSTPDQYEAIIDQCDSIAQTLRFKYNQVVSGSNMITMGNISRIPYVKKYEDCVTGVLFSFTLNGPDKTDQSGNCE